MDRNFAAPFQRRRRGEMAAYLLGMGPMPPPRPEEIAVAKAIHDLDRLEEFSEENIDPRLRAQGVAMDAQVIVRVPIGYKLTRDMKFPTSISHHDFFNRVCAAMDVDPNTTRLGWKSNDDPKRSPAHQLLTGEEMNDAFRKLLNVMRNPRRYKEVVMEIIHLNAPAAQEVKSNQTRRLSYIAALHIVQERLSCTQHAEPNRWCYVNPKNPSVHLALGKEEVRLWARKIHNLEALPDCMKPPHCLRLDDPPPEKEIQTLPNMRAANIPPIHVHINNRSTNMLNLVDTPQRGLKRPSLALSDSSGGDSDSHSSLLSDILEDLHRKFPQFNFPQYSRILEARGIFYAENAVDCDRDYFVELGLSEGAAASFLSAIRNAITRQQPARKRARVSLKENGI